MGCDSVVLCGVVWCGVVWCGVVWCGVVWCGVVWCSVVWYDSVVWFYSVLRIVVLACLRCDLVINLSFILRFLSILHRFLYHSLRSHPQSSFFFPTFPGLKIM